MATAYISLGSNIEAEHHLRIAINELRKHYGELQLSSVYESEAVGFEGDNFLNMVVALQSEQSVEIVAATLRDIEDQHGRVRSGPRFSPRTLDLDLLLYDALILDKASGLDIPRDEITKNAFVLLPLAELAPDFLHPVQQLSMRSLWNAFDQSSQKLWPVPMEF